MGLCVSSLAGFIGLCSAGLSMAGSSSMSVERLHGVLMLLRVFLRPSLARSHGYYSSIQPTFFSRSFQGPFWRFHP